MSAPAREVLLALDVGEARIGVARGETDSPLVFGRGAIRRRRPAEDVAEVARLAEAEGAARVVVGLPRRTDGRDSKQTQRVRAFARALREAGLDVAFEDERFTTRVAERQIALGPLSAAKRREKGRVDEASAVLILETHLARLRADAADGATPDAGAEGGRP